jgi:hypothetical protein
LRRKRQKNTRAAERIYLGVEKSKIILNSAVKEDENGADAQKHEGF